MQLWPTVPGTCLEGRRVSVLEKVGCYEPRDDLVPDSTRAETKAGPLQRGGLQG